MGMVVECDVVAERRPELVELLRAHAAGTMADGRAASASKCWRTVRLVGVSPHPRPAVPSIPFRGWPSGGAGWCDST